MNCKDSGFCIEEADGKIYRLSHSGDTYNMNWAAGNTPWGTIKAPAGIAGGVFREITAQGNLRETYRFTNATGFPIFIRETDLGIYVTFNDDYESSAICRGQRCHTHIFCGGSGSWVMAVRMGGEAPHLGLKLVRGGLQSYSVERDTGRQSNDRGDFILHPELTALAPGETAVVCWELFWFEDSTDFMEKLRETDNFPVLHTEQCTCFPGEFIDFKVSCKGAPDDALVEVLCNGVSQDFHAIIADGVLQVSYRQQAEATGEYSFKIIIGEKTLDASFYVSSTPEALAGQRCGYIADHQQYFGCCKPLNGAYLIYDRETDKIYYDHAFHDHNGGRERIGMGVLVARYLQIHRDAALEASLRKYTAYVYGQLYDEATGAVANDIGHNMEWHRLYNYPWMAVFQLELYYLTGRMKYLLDACKTICHFYESGGTEFYPIGLPVRELVEAAEALGCAGQREPADALDCAKQRETEAALGCAKLKDTVVRMTELFFKNADFILETGTNYPESEVKYEQSIVAPAVDCLLQAYELSGEPRYLTEARCQLDILLLFNGSQPDYHQFGNAIRHWDGYWFGKYQMYGDTYPHYWSALTGCVLMRFMRIIGETGFLGQARASLRGCLSLFSQDGAASCAMVFPASVNGQQAHYYDPWANDQDWALYYALKYADAIG